MGVGKYYFVCPKLYKGFILISYDL